MKIIFTLCAVMTLGGLTAFGQTNSVPQKVQSPAPAQKTDAKPKNAGEWREVARTSETPEQIAAARQSISHRLFKQTSVNDYNTEIDQIFHSGNDQAGNTEVRNTIVTIYPTGR